MDFSPALESSAGGVARARHGRTVALERWTEEGITRKIQKWLSGQFLSELIRYQLESRDGQWRLQFDFDPAAFERLLGRRLGRTVLLTNRMDWTAGQGVGGLCGQ